jgi:tetratricopeptide (TPR) repeat protein
VPDTLKAVELATLLLARARRHKDGTYQRWATLRLCQSLAVVDLRNRWQEIHLLLKKGLREAQDMEEALLVVEHTSFLGSYAVAVGELEMSMQWTQQTLTEIETLDDFEDQAYYRYMAYASLSSLKLKCNDSAEALRCAEIAVGEAQRYGNPFCIAKAHLVWGNTLHTQGARAKALETVRQVRTEAQQKDWSGVDQRASYLLSGMLLASEEVVSALKAARRALGLARDLQMKEAEVLCLINLGVVMRANGRDDDARLLLRDARRLCQERDYADHFTQVEELLQSEEHK